MARRIVELMPPHIHYVEPFAGGLAVLLAKNPVGVSEVVNDLNGALCNFWKVLREPVLFEKFYRIVQATPFSEPIWRESHDSLEIHPNACEVDRAVWFFVTCRQSLAGRMNGFAPLSHARTRRGMNEQASAWLTSIEGLPSVHHRLQRVAILNRPALDVLYQEDAPETLFYCAPPYLHQTRTVNDAYAHEMTEDQHRQLLQALKTIKGKVMLSGYQSELYDRAVPGWNRHFFELPNNAAGGDKKRRMIEVVWCNF